MSFEKLMDLLNRWRWQTTKNGHPLYISLSDIRPAVIEYGQAEYERGLKDGANQ